MDPTNANESCLSLSCSFGDGSGTRSVRQTFPRLTPEIP